MENVKIPEFVADYIERKRGVANLFGVMNGIKYDAAVNNWIHQDSDCNSESRINEIAIAWIFGYDVVEEKKYIVKFNGLKDGENVLNNDLIENEWYLGDDTNTSAIQTHHTRKELEDAGFGWTLKSGIAQEIEQ